MPHNHSYSRYKKRFVDNLLNNNQSCRISSDFSQLGLRPRQLSIRRYSARFRRIIVNYCDKETIFKMPPSAKKVNTNYGFSVDCRVCYAVKNAHRDTQGGQGKGEKRMIALLWSSVPQLSLDSKDFHIIFTHFFLHENLFHFSQRFCFRLVKMASPPVSHGDHSITHSI